MIMKALPSFIELGGHVITIEQEPLEDVYGYFEYEKLRIVIDSTSQPSLQWETLFHEIIEAINALGEYELEHFVIQQLGVWMHQAVFSMATIEPEPLQ
jgi:hypothetical protein